MDGFIQIGVTAARDPATGAFLPAVPLYIEAAMRVISSGVSSIPWENQRSRQE